jgi:16S rRNA C967 or C1407 C5-methylase (RsmB/RsmF family)
MKQDRKSIFSHDSCNGIAVEMTHALFHTCPLNELTKRYPSELFAQNLASMIVAHLVDPKPGERILDMCGAPGGKTSHLALLMHCQGQIYTCDRLESKVQAMKTLFQSMRLNIMNADMIKVIKLDSTKATLSSCMNSGNLKNLERRLVFDEESFDRVLLDAPCSGLGNRPTLSHEHVTLKAMKEMAMYQRQLFNEAVKLVKIGGTITYSTCTLNCMENEENVLWALNKYKGILELDLPDEKYLRNASPGLDNILGKENASKVLRFCPYQNPEHIGFFAARFKKIGTHIK